MTETSWIGLRLSYNTTKRYKLYTFAISHVWMDNRGVQCCTVTYKSVFRKWRILIIQSAFLSVTSLTTSCVTHVRDVDDDHSYRRLKPTKLDRFFNYKRLLFMTTKRVWLWLLNPSFDSLLLISSVNSFLFYFIRSRSVHIHEHLLLVIIFFIYFAYSNLLVNFCRLFAFSLRYFKLKFTPCATYL